MFNVIDFLERVGQDARLRQDMQDEVALALANEEIDPDVRVAILSKDQQWLESFLGQAQHCCLMFPAEEEEDGEGNDDGETPSREDEASSCHVLRVMAQ
ncbi:MAG TPA: hypothetical protein VN043_17780 [Rhodanobacter sp.]|nr:hypothetical protein [Rhodanobacter sp.]